MTHLSVVVPVYNESSLIEELIRRVAINVKKITQDFEIIVVDDGSIDQTWELIEKEAQKEKAALTASALNRRRGPAAAPFPARCA